MIVQLRYDLVGTGWASCDIEIDGQHAHVSASYLSDALDELCRAVVEQLSGEHESRASFDEEPGEYRWHLQRVDADQMRVRILEFPELWGGKADDEGTVVFDATCRRRTFAGALLSELQRLLHEYGEAGYKERWDQHDFPSRRLGQLKELLA